MKLQTYKDSYKKQLNGPEDDYWKNGIIKNKPHYLLEQGYAVIDESIIYEFYFDTEDLIENERLFLKLL
ncbi:MAG: hypothetical protein JXR88_11030 [Clostridia bacterium]|nr:hypothetical protein [Clostridia bacterium]